MDTFIEHLVDKAFENTPREAIPELPVSALQGISERQAELLAEAFGIRTIGQLGSNLHFQRAHALVMCCAART
jgi:hypothetical protein